MHRVHHGHYYAKAQNLARRLRKAYDDALSEHDLLLMPMSPIPPPTLPGPNATREELAYPGFIPTFNAAPFDVTGHPALSVPCGLAAGLPVGMQLIARHFEEATMYRAAHAYERAVHG
jgi:amidase